MRADRTYLAGPSWLRGEAPSAGGGAKRCVVCSMRQATRHSGSPGRAFTGRQGGESKGPGSFGSGQFTMPCSGMVPSIPAQERHPCENVIRHDYGLSGNALTDKERIGLTVQVDEILQLQQTFFLREHPAGDLPVNGRHLLQEYAPPARPSPTAVTAPSPPGHARQ